MSQSCERRVIAQVEFVGETFERKPDKSLPFSNQKRVRIVGGYDEEKGQVVFEKASDAPIQPSDLPHLPLDCAEEMHDIANVQGQSLLTVRKKGASISGVDMDEIYRQRGGDPSHRLAKKGGFFMESTTLEIEKERKKRKARGS